MFKHDVKNGSYHLDFSQKLNFCNSDTEWETHFFK